MKTQQEIEKMKEDLQYKINNFQNMSFSNKTGGNQRLADHYENEANKAMAQYNILLEVLK